ncbi:hypothetical protein SteCoe_32543 [Stentor coeruleus]|uniref:Uncharacterized protein n=1 Tax=Stentor coeruleus TaxID=5963 RepID=A0A1R2AYS6_9CILI|nr:hypothetical protein SteCoe_32543 [Stentor coeruleus]
MSRDTVIIQETPKYFQGEDRPAKPKKVVHLVTYPNFLSCDGDHSQDRPFTNSSPARKKKLFERSQFYSEKGYVPPYNDFKQDRKKIEIKEGHHALSTTNPLKFDPSEKVPEDKAEIKRSPFKNQSNLSGANAQPINDEIYRASKRMHSGKYTDSSSMKLSLSYI